MLPNTLVDLHADPIHGVERPQDGTTVKRPSMPSAQPHAKVNPSRSLDRGGAEGGKQCLPEDAVFRMDPSEEADDEVCVGLVAVDVQG